MLYVTKRSSANVTEHEKEINLFLAIKDFKISYGETVVLRQIVKITSGDVMTRVPMRLSRRSLAYYYGKVPSFTYSLRREYKPAVYFAFSRFFFTV